MFTAGNAGTGLPTPTGVGGWDNGGQGGEELPWTIPQDGVANQDWSGDAGLNDPDAYNPIPPLTHDGHEYGSSGGFQSQLESVYGHSWNIGGGILDGRLEDIAGSVITDLQNEIGDNYQDNVLYSTRKSSGDWAGGNGWVATAQMGWNLSPQAHAKLNSTIEANLSIDSQTMAMNGGLSDDEVDVTGDVSDAGFDFFRIDIQAAELSAIGAQWNGSLLMMSKDSGKAKNELDVDAQGGIGATDPGDASGFVKFDWDGDGFSMIRLTSDTVHEFLVGGSDYSWDRIDNHQLKWVSTATYDSSGDAKATLASGGGTTLTGSGSSSTKSTRDYSAHSREFYDDRSWGYDNWSRQVYDWDRWSAFGDEISQSASFDASRSQPLVVGDPTRTGDDQVRVWETYKAGNGGSSDMSVAFADSSMQWMSQWLTHDDHFMTEPFAEIEYWLEGLSDDPLPDAYPELPDDYV